jgi:hypothetical protein
MIEKELLWSLKKIEIGHFNSFYQNFREVKNKKLFMELIIKMAFIMYPIQIGLRARTPSQLLSLLKI